MLAKLPSFTISCKYCRSTNVVRYGSYHGIQRWWCKDCQRKFADNDALPGMRVGVGPLASALRMFYEGTSLTGIKRHLNKKYRIYPSDSTIYEWITRFTALAVGATEKCPIKAGDTWLICDKALRLNGKETRFYDVVDIRSGFLLASQYTPPGFEAAGNILERAIQRGGKTPDTIVTYKTRNELGGQAATSKSKVKHAQPDSLWSRPYAAVVNTFQGSLTGREKIMRAAKKEESARLFYKGWLIYYNFFRKHRALGNRTPAERAGILVAPASWMERLRKYPGKG